MAFDESMNPISTHIYRDEIADTLRSHQRDLFEAMDALRALSGELSSLTSTMITTVQAGCKIMLAGNGGSAAEAQHFSAELVGRFRRERIPYAALALTTDTSILTAIGNDYSYDEIFSRQIIALGKRGDLLIAFSTSGESRNLLLAAQTARERGIPVAAVTGRGPNSLAHVADLVLPVSAHDAATVQELHTMITHIVCEITERELSKA